MAEERLSLGELRSMDPYEFEQFIAGLWKNRGYETTVSQQSLDGGLDVIADDGGERVAIQAKRYGLDNAVGVKTIRETSNLTNRADIDRVTVVTTSDFTKAAYKEANQYDVKLYDGDSLLRLARRTGTSQDPHWVLESLLKAAKGYRSFIIGDGNPTDILLRLAAITMIWILFLAWIGVIPRGI